MGNSWSVRILLLLCWIELCTSQNGSAWPDVGEFVTLTPDLSRLAVENEISAPLLSLGPAELWRGILNFGDSGLYGAVGKKLLEGAPLLETTLGVSPSECVCNAERVRLDCKSRLCFTVCIFESVWTHPVTST